MKQFATKRYSQCNGATLVETAVCLPPLLLIISICFATAVTAYYAMAMNYTIASAKRWVILNQIHQGSNGPLSRSRSTEYEVWKIGKTFGLSFGTSEFDFETNHPNISICPIANAQCHDEDYRAGPGQVFVINVKHPVNFGFGQFNLKAKTIGRTEPNA